VKITKLTDTRPLMSLTGMLAGSSGGTGPSGQVPTSNGSNSVAWGSNVAVITADASNTILGPYVNFASGSNVNFTFDGAVGSVPSNTIRIHAQATGGGGGGGGGFPTVVPAYIWAVGASSGFLTPTVICQGTGTLNAHVHMSVSGAVFVNLMKNGVRQQQLTASSTGTQTFTGISVVANDQVYIAMSSGGTAFPDSHADNLNALTLTAGMAIMGGPVAGMAIA